MQKIINQILEGNFEYENGSLDFSCEKIELSLAKGESCEGSFRVYATPGQFATGKDYQLRLTDGMSYRGVCRLG